MVGYTFMLTSQQLINSRSIMDELLGRFENIEAFSLMEDPMLLGYVMHVQMKNPDFRWNLEDF